MSISKMNVEFCNQIKSNQERVSLIAIVYHVQLTLLKSLGSLLANATSSADELRSRMLASIHEALRRVCSVSSSPADTNTATTTSNYFGQSQDAEAKRKLIVVQQSSLADILALAKCEGINNNGGLDRLHVLDMLAIFVGHCSSDVFINKKTTTTTTTSPTGVYGECKCLLDTMRSSANARHLLAVLDLLRRVVDDKRTSRELRVLLLKDNLSHLVKMAVAAGATLGDNSSSSSSSSTSAAIDTTAPKMFTVESDDGVALCTCLLDLLESMVTVMGCAGAASGDDQTPLAAASKDQEALTVFVHVLGTFLQQQEDDPTKTTDATLRRKKKRSDELNAYAIKKLLALGLSHKQELKQVLEKWPALKAKIATAFKNSAATATSSGLSNQQQLAQQQQQQQNLAASQQNKAPKIQLNFNFSTFK